MATQINPELQGTPDVITSLTEAPSRPVEELMKLLPYGTTVYRRKNDWVVRNIQRGKVIGTSSKDLWLALTTVVEKYENT